MKNGTLGYKREQGLKIVRSLLRVLLAALALMGALAVPSRADSAGSYRARATTPEGPALFFGQPVKLWFIDRARTSGSVRYKVCVIETRRRCYARTFIATASASRWDTFTVKTTQATRPMIALWYVASRLVWATTLKVYGD